jgi:hypothetical protein
MEIIGGMKAYTLEEVEDDLIGPKGTPERDAYEQRFQEELEEYRKRQSATEETEQDLPSSI